MKTNLIIAPFDIEWAKKIQNEGFFGKIVTRDGRAVRIVCWDMKDEDYPIVAIHKDDKGREATGVYSVSGRFPSIRDGENPLDLVLHIPICSYLKDGDVFCIEYITGKKEFHVLKDEMSITCSESGRAEFSSHVKYDDIIDCRASTGGHANIDVRCIDSIRLLTNEEKQMFVKELIKGMTYYYRNEKEIVKDVLKRSFGVEEEVCEFNPKDWVLCRMLSGEWCLCQFSNKTTSAKGNPMYVAVGGIAYERCIIYNDDTKHLLGTTDKWKVE